MSDSETETIFVRDYDGLRQLTTSDSWTVMTLAAALSADPRSFDEFTRAWLRYRPHEPLEELPWIDEAGEPGDTPWMLFDLACQRILAGGGAELPENPGAFQRDEGPWEKGNPVVWINFPPGWECAEVTDWCRALAPLPVPNEPLDVRGVLFGRALAEGIACRTLEIARRESLPQRISWDERNWDEPASDEERENSSQWHSLTIRVHADWLMTARADLEGEMPRAFLHRGRNWVDRELQNRQLQWSQEGKAPRALDRDTFAYRHGPLGLDEVVMYFDLCREIIDFAWERIVESPHVDESLLTQEIHDHIRWWLAEGSIDGDPTPPAEIIESERRRMPLVSGANHIDCDCPICRMEVEGGFGPSFQCFDGHHLELDDEFAFSLCKTREEWEKQQEEFRQMCAEMDEKQRQREADEDEFASVWQSSYVDEEAVRQAGPSSTLSMMAVGVRVAELVTDLQDAGEDRNLVVVLNEAFDAYRAAGKDPALAAAATSRLVDALEDIAAASPGLTPKVADLQSQLDERTRHNDMPF